MSSSSSTFFALDDGAPSTSSLLANEDDFATDVRAEQTDTSLFTADSIITTSSGSVTFQHTPPPRGSSSLTGIPHLQRPAKDPPAEAAPSADTISLVPGTMGLPAPEMIFGTVAIAEVALDGASPAAPEIGAGSSVSVPFFIDSPIGVPNAISPIADQDLHGSAARSTFGVDGTGIKIGIISDSFNLKSGAAADEASGALPAASLVHILKDGTSGNDEGRAMAEIAHSIAPGASIYFYTCGNTDAQMAQAITALQQAGCQIIVDDVSFFDEPDFEQGGTISQAIDQAVANGSTYFTAAGNASNSFYQGTFTPTAAPAQGGGSVQANAFNVAGAPANWLEPITIPSGASVILDLQWDQPFRTSLGVANGAGSANSLAFQLFNSNMTGVAFGNTNAIGSNPLQLATYTNHTANTTFYLAVYQNVATGPTPGIFKIIVDDNSFTPVTFNDPNGSTGSGTIDGHEEDLNAITVGAAPENNPTTMEPFSSVGPGTFLFDANGNKLAAPISAGKVDLVAPDGNATTVSGINPFYGTSAAAPAAAAVGALVLQENPSLNPSDIANILANTATPMSGSTALTGAGLVNALAAVTDAQDLAFQESASVATLLGTHLNDSFLGGPGNHALDGGTGINTLDYSNAPAAVTIDLSTGIATNGYGGSDSFLNIGVVKGSAFADSFVSGPAGATLYGDGGLDVLNFGSLGAGGTLVLGGGTFTSASSADNGIISLIGGGALTVTGALANSGTIVANGGTVTLAGGVTGPGSLLLENGGIFELGGAVAQGVSFGPGIGTLKLDQPASFTGGLGNLALGDTLDFVSTSVTGGRILGSLLTVSLSNGSNLIYSVFGTIGGTGFTAQSDGANGTELVRSNVAFNLAHGRVDGPQPLALGTARVGGTLAQTLSITNSAAGPAEALDASVESTTGATGSGTISLLGAGQTDAGHILVGLSTATAGVRSGTVTLAFSSDGTNTDGNGLTPLPSQQVQVSGRVYRLAAPNVAALPSLIVHVGDVVAPSLVITNSAVADGFSEALIAAVAGTTGGISASGSTGDIVAQGSGGLTLGFSTASAGTVASSVTLNFQSDGTGIDGFAPIADGSQTVAVTATIDNFAQAAISELSGGGTFTHSGTSYALDLGAVARGSVPIVVGLGVSNSATGPADLLAGSFATSASSAFTLAGFGAFTGLASGQSDTAPTVTFNSSTGGSFSETITLTPIGSNASGYSGGVAVETLTITGTVVTSVNWAGPNAGDRSGEWNVAANWSPASVPTALTSATIGAAGSYVVTSTQSNSVGALTLSDAAGTLAVSGGTFAILGASTNAGTIAAANGGAVQITGVLTNTGTVALASAGSLTSLVVAGDATLRGKGRLTLGDAIGNTIVSNGAAATLTNQSTITGSGTIGDNFLSLFNRASGIINATGSTASLTITGTHAVVNNGIIEATGAAGLVINTTINDGGGSIAAAGGNVYLEGATLAGDTLQTSAGSVIETLDSTSVLNAATNMGTLSVTDGTALTLKGTITNDGTMAVSSSGDTTSLILGAATTITGAGAVIMTDSATNSIVGNGSAKSLTNMATIAGSGTIGDAAMTLSNAATGIIDATGAANALTINTGGHAVNNSGLIEATAAGGLTIASALTNSGRLAASGGATLTVTKAVTGAGQATIANGTLDFASSVSATQAITFAQGTTGILQLGVAQNFAGTVAGLAQGDAIDLQNFRFSGNPTILGITAIMQNAAQVGAAITVKDGALTATINLLNQFGVSYSTSPAAYTLTSDNSGAHPGTLLQLAPPVA